VHEVEWVVLIQHMLNYAWLPIDGAGIEMLSVEQALAEYGIETHFLPYRPGESGGFTDALNQPLQLLVKRHDLTRAREVARETLGPDTDLLIPSS